MAAGLGEFLPAWQIGSQPAAGDTVKEERNSRLAIQKAEHDLARILLWNSEGGRCCADLPVQWTDGKAVTTGADKTGFT
jgi:hypothetical protein